MAIVMDGCVLSDNDTKCDALFLYHRGNRKYSFLVELKGAAEIEKAFYQLSYTRFQRDEYKNIIKKFNDIDQIKVNEKFAVVSNGMLPKPVVEKLENQYGIRVRSILHCESTTHIPDLKCLIAN